MKFLSVCELANDCCSSLSETLQNIIGGVFELLFGLIEPVTTCLYMRRQKDEIQTVLQDRSLVTRAAKGKEMMDEPSHELGRMDIPTDQTLAKIYESVKISDYPLHARFSHRSTLDLITLRFVKYQFSTPTPDREDEELIDYIMRYARELFTVCILVTDSTKQQKRAMQSAKKNHIKDDMIPITAFDIDKIWSGDKFWSFRTGFRNDQCIFRAPTLSHDERYSQQNVQNVLPGAALPIILADDARVSKGGFATVRRVIIDELYLDKNDPIRQVRFN